HDRARSLVRRPALHRRDAPSALAEQRSDPRSVRRGAWRRTRVPGDSLPVHRLDVRLVAAGPPARLHDERLSEPARALPRGYTRYPAGAPVRDGAPLRLDHLVAGRPAAPPRRQAREPLAAL